MRIIMILIALLLLQGVLLLLVAHNEDDGGEQMLNWYRVPEIKHGTADFYSFKNGGREPMPSRTNGYLWLELQKMKWRIVNYLALTTLSCLLWIFSVNISRKEVICNNSIFLQ